MLDLLTAPDTGLAVVPVVANVGTALLPAIVAGIGTVVSLLFKPKELIAAIKRKPGTAMATFLALIVLGGGGWWMFFGPTPEEHGTATASAPGGGATTAGGAGVDWTKVALELIRQERAAATRPAPAAVAPTAPSSTAPAEVAPGSVPPAAAGKALIFRGDNARTGHLGGPAPKTPLQPLWAYPEENTMFLSSPIVHGGRVFGATCYMDPPRTYGAVVCLDAATGAVRWRTDKAGRKDFRGFFSSPALSADGKRLVIGQGLHPDKNVALVCLDADNGNVLWSVPTELHVESSPAIDGDLVVVGFGAIEDPKTHKPTSHHGYVAGIRLSDGKVLWQEDVNDPEGSPSIVDGVVYIGSGFNGNAVVALRAEEDTKGQPRQLWRVETPFPATGAVSVAGDLVLIGCGNGDFVFAAPNPQGQILAIERATGKVRWKKEMPDGVLGAIAVAGDVGYVPVRNGELFAISLADGSTRWRQEAVESRLSKRGTMLSGPAVADGLIYAVSGDGYLGVFAAKDGALVERHYLNDKDRPGEQGLGVSGPVLLDGRLYVGSETGGLRCFGGAQ